MSSGLLVSLSFVLDSGLDTPPVAPGAVAPGADLTNGFKIDGKFVPAVKAKIDLPKVFKGVKNVWNEVDKKLFP